MSVKLLILAICAVLAYLAAVAWSFRVMADEPDPMAAAWGSC